MCNIVIHTHTCGHNIPTESVDRCRAALFSGIDCDPALPAKFRLSINSCKDCSLAVQQGVIVNAVSAKDPLSIQYMSFDFRDDNGSSIGSYGRQGPYDHSISPAKLLFLRGQGPPPQLRRRALTDPEISLLENATIIPNPPNVGHKDADQREKELAEKDPNVTKPEAEVGATHAGSSAEKAIADKPVPLTLITDTAPVVSNAEDEEPEVEAQAVYGPAPNQSTEETCLRGAESGAGPSDLIPKPSGDLITKEAFFQNQSITSNVPVISGSASTPLIRPNLNDLTPVDGKQRVRNWLSAQGKVKITSLLDKAGYVLVSADTSRVRSSSLDQSPTRRPKLSTLRSKKAVEGKWYPFVDEDAIFKKNSSQKDGHAASSSSAQPPYLPETSGEALMSSAPVLTIISDGVVRIPPPLRLPSPFRALSSISSTVSELPHSNDENADPSLTGPIFGSTRLSVSPERPSIRPPLADKVVPSLANLKLNNAAEWHGTPAPRSKQPGGSQAASPTKPSDSKSGLMFPPANPNQAKLRAISSDGLPSQVGNTAQERNILGLKKLGSTITQPVNKSWDLSQATNRTTDSRPPVAALKLSMGIGPTFDRTLKPELIDLKNTSIYKENEESHITTATNLRSSELSAIDIPNDPFLSLLPPHFQTSENLNPNEEDSSAITKHFSGSKSAPISSSNSNEQGNIDKSVLDQIITPQPLPPPSPNQALNLSPTFQWFEPFYRGWTLASELLDIGESVFVFERESDSTDGQLWGEDVSE
ncbi:MAG: hypothetical protein M1812_007270 [Candelaria pacifica]|nr:MAG: hypothetical protein M1812_007270 [Candelaria pacifica]